jgi:hypothetical protein
MIFVGLLFLLANQDKALIQQVTASGRVLEICVSDSERISPRPQVAPGGSQLLSFRFFDGRQRRRFGELDLVIDDAGH